MAAPERFAESQIPLALRAPSIHDPMYDSRWPHIRSPIACLLPGKATVISLSSRPEDLAPAKESPLDPYILETIQIAGQGVLSQHGHVRNLADFE